jgi:dTDP-4-amino-4,6-dideoxygalactose transaminase
VATAEVIALMGLKPVLVDIDPDTFNILPEAIEKAITKNTKAIIPVHLFGQCANMEAITKIAKKHNLYIVEDTAQALGSDYIWPDGKRAKAGTIGDIGTTSFFPSKNLGCMGDGGAIMTNSGELAEKISLLANHGMDKQYYYESVGVNSRLDTLQAAILEVKLRYLNEYNGKRKAAADAYTEHLQGIDEVVCPVIAPYTTHIFHQYTLKIKGEGNRDALMKHLTDLKIPVKVYYPVPLHDHKPYRLNAVYNEADLKNTIQVSNEVLSLPMHTELTPDQIDFITGAIKDFFKKK